VGDIKWVKLTTDMFDNRKIKHLRRLPEGNNIVLIWVMLLTMAGRCNAGGMIFLTENIPYTPKMLADELGFEEAIVHLALKALEQLSMIVYDRGCFSIAGWEEYQNIEGMERIRESKRLAQARWRAKQKELPVESTVESTRCLVDYAEEDIEQEKNKKEDKSICQQVVDMYHDICRSFPAVRSLSDARRKSIKARLKDYTMDDFRQVFQNAEASSFLKGLDGGWKASFDWLIKEANMLKVLEGIYADKGWKQKSVMQPSMSMGQAELEAIQRVLSEDY
jgi:predicted phage replisome organizer